ncbi:inositol monophosphatase family protein [Lactobacillus sp. CC-MHH1034]|uniref:inositol monophosphatase family protein n=1 Tax=Agrilactobacillus fermenti TaxID=2586909 RepID=UPI001E504AD2|nr:inositol monophosphatase family protein [Agrilactobacillus fermenti]MCD2255273.1 inositol monophosphatase family protein [Agrilactobacillus fermenti]
MTVNSWQIATKLKIWIQAAGQHLRQHLYDDLQVATKSNRNDLVTNMDKATEKLLVQEIRQAFPEAKIIGEEGFGDKVADLSGLVFFVDPIDGTMNFVKEKENFAIMIGAYLDGKGIVGVILDVVRQKIFWGGPEFGVYCNDIQIKPPKNIDLAAGLLGVSGPLLRQNKYHVADFVAQSSGARIIGSAGVEFTKVIQGIENGYISHLMTWDFAAGKIMAETLGLKVTNIDGDPLNMLSSEIVLIATERTHQQIMTITREHS